MAKATRYDRLSANSAAATEADDDEDNGAETGAADEEEEQEAESETAEADAEDGAEDDGEADGNEADAEEDDDDEASPSASARQAERQRMSAIISEGSKRGLPRLANRLACNTDLSAKAALAVLKSAAADAGKKASGSAGSAGKAALNRLAANNPSLGDSEAKVKASEDDPKTVAAQIVADAKRLAG